MQTFTLYIYIYILYKYIIYKNILFMEIFLLSQIKVTIFETNIHQTKSDRRHFGDSVSEDCGTCSNPTYQGKIQILCF